MTQENNLPKDGSLGSVRITGYEANFLLFLLDEQFNRNETSAIEEFSGLVIKQLEDLRERLFNAHEHPPAHCIDE